MVDGAPRIFRTSEQRLSARYDKRARLLGDKLAIFKARQHLTNREIGRTLGIRDETISRIINGDRTVRLPLEVLWRIEDMVKIEEGSA